MAFQRYTKSGRTGRPLASLWSRGHIALNQGAVQRFQLTGYRLCVLFYDADTQRIGLKFTNDDTEPGAVSVTRGKTGVVISAMSFCNCYGIAHAKTQKYPIEYNAHDALHVIDLTMPMTNSTARMQRGKLHG